jgi:hypothetical protein
MPTNCTATRSFAVACGQCGNGIVDPGEDCDSVTAFMNHTCDPNTCKFIPVVCGNGLIQPPTETCDSSAAFAAGTCAPPGGITVNNVPGPGTTFIQGCNAITPKCGDGVVQSATEQCDPPNGTTCDPNCQTISPCLVCEKSQQCLGTNQQSSTGVFQGCGGLTGAAKTNCQNLLSCLETHPYCSNPANVSPAFGDPTPCFCGALDPASCAGATSTTINGPCTGAYYAVLGVTTATSTNANRDTVLNTFFDKTGAIGEANNVYACDVQNSCIAVANPVCP